MTLKDIHSLPTSHHETHLRSYHILELVKVMIKRGDSRETIFDTIEYLGGNRKQEDEPDLTAPNATTRQSS